MKYFINKKEELKQLKTFDCVCYFRDGTEHKSKFLLNAKKGVYLRFYDKKHSYIIMDKENIIFIITIYTRTFKIIAIISMKKRK